MKRTAGSRSALIVPRKPEKQSLRDPVEGREAPGHGTAEGKHEQDSKPIAVSTKLQQIAEKSGCATSAANPLFEEPDAVVPHVRICRGAGASNRLGLPDQFGRRCMQLLAGNRGAAPALARGPWPRSLACDPLADAKVPPG